MPSVKFNAFSNGKWIRLNNSPDPPKNINFYTNFLHLLFLKRKSFSHPPLKSNSPHKEKNSYNYLKNQFSKQKISYVCTKIF